MLFCVDTQKPLAFSLSNKQNVLLIFSFKNCIYLDEVTKTKYPLQRAKNKNAECRVIKCSFVHDPSACVSYNFYLRFFFF